MLSVAFIKLAELGIHTVAQRIPSKVKHQQRFAIFFSIYLGTIIAIFAVNKQKYVIRITLRLCRVNM